MKTKSSPTAWLGWTSSCAMKEAARVQGLPYQVYIKKALYDRAKADIAEHYQLQALRRGELNGVR